VVVAVTENPYMQAFCGFREFVTEEILDKNLSSQNIISQVDSLIEKNIQLYKFLSQ